MPKFLVVYDNNQADTVPAIVQADTVNDIADLLFNTTMVVNIDDDTFFDQRYETWRPLLTMAPEDIVDPNDDDSWDDPDEDDEDAEEDDVRYPAGAED